MVAWRYAGRPLKWGRSQGEPNYDGPAYLLVELFTGFTTLDRASTLGLNVDGDRSALTRLLPVPPAPISEERP
ncbi:MAG: hypothetical protein C0482_23290 [Gordonia sp.]|nr:hypothetical protein [Gordonia sp. (in: high G+C Gram-positive bacteria)]